MNAEAHTESRIRGLVRRLWIERAIFLFLLAGVLALHFGKLGGKRVCVIAVDGRPVAVVASRAGAARLLEEIKRSSGLPGNVTFSHRVTLYSAPAAGHRAVSDAEAMQVLATKLEPVVEAAAILANGELVMGLPTRNEAVQALSDLLREFSPPGAGVQATFRENVKVETREVAADRFAASASAALEKIRKAAAPKGSHEVNPGETVWKIALDYHVPISRLAAANPGLDTNRIRAGDQLKIPGESPPLTVIARKESREELGPGMSRTLRITYENGVEVSRDVIARERPPSQLGGARHRRRPQRGEGFVP